jgi:hypothetical protein
VDEPNRVAGLCVRCGHVHYGWPVAAGCTQCPCRSGQFSVAGCDGACQGTGRKPCGACDEREGLKAEIQRLRARRRLEW